MVNVIDGSATESFNIDRLIAEGKTEEARRLVTQRLGENPADRYSQLSLLLLDATAQGPWPSENQIEGLSGLSDLTNGERQVIHRLYQLCYETAELEKNEKKMWRYQRLLRNLVLRRAAPAVSQRTTPQAKTFTDPRLGFSLEGEDRSSFPKDTFSVEAKTSQRRLQIRYVVFPACLLMGGELAFLLMIQYGNTGSVTGPQIASPSLPAKPAGAVTTAPITRPAPLETARHEANESLAAATSVAGAVVVSKGLLSGDAAIGSGVSVKDAKGSEKKAQSAAPEKPLVPRATSSVNPVIAEIRRLPNAKSLMPKPPPLAREAPDTFLVGRDVVLNYEPRSSSQELQLLGTGAAVTVLEAQGEWLKVKTQQDGTFGFVPKDAVAPRE